MDLIKESELSEAVDKRVLLLRDFEQMPSNPVGPARDSLLPLALHGHLLVHSRTASGTKGYRQIQEEVHMLPRLATSQKRNRNTFPATKTLISN